MTTLRDAPGTAATPAAPASWPFTPIEELDFYLENAGEPSLVQLETHAEGHLDRAALAAAVAGALATDPAARRRLAATSRWGRRLRWESGPASPEDAQDAQDAQDALVTVAWDGPAELAALRERMSGWPMSLAEGAVRVILAAGPDHDVVIQHTHHAAFDGISSLALFTAICTGYRNRAAAAARPATAAPVGPGDRPRGTAPATARGLAGPGRRGPGPARLPAAVTRIAPHGGRPGRPGYGAALRSVGVPRPARRGGGPSPTVNDLLVAALIAAVDRWNSAHGRRAGTIRITVPVNTRDAGQRWAGPGNLSRLIRVTARPADRADGARLLACVAAQTRAGKLDTGSGLDAVSRLLAAGWAPAPVKRHAARLARRLARPLCTDTSLVSNLGVVPEPPSLSGSGREPVWFSGPAPMPRGLAVGAVTVAGRLHLSVHYRPALLDAGAAEEFTDGYCRALAELAGVPGLPGVCQPPGPFRETPP